MSTTEKLALIVGGAVSLVALVSAVVQWVEKAPSDEQRMLRAAKEAARDDRMRRNV